MSEKMERECTGSSHKDGDMQSSDTHDFMEYVKCC